MIKLPEILNIPDKLLPVVTEFNNNRYFLLDGGRSGGKSQSIARFILYLAEQKLLRVVCGREIQNTIEESVYKIFVDLIKTYSLNFEVFSNKITHNATGSEIRFRGLREQGSVNIQGLEGVDILWVDEAQAIKKQTLDVIIPTIRKEKAKLFWSMNRYVEDDPVYKFFVDRPDCLHIHLNYNENEFCPKVMISEAEECKIKDIDDYNHIWLGEPLKQADDLLFNFAMIDGSPKLKFDYFNNYGKILAIDVARYGSAETVFCIIEKVSDSHIIQIHQETWKDRSLMEVVGKALDLRRTFETDLMVVDDDGMGGGVTDRLRELKFKMQPFKGGAASGNPLYTNLRTEGYYKLKDLFDRNFLKILDDKKLKEQLLAIKYRYKSTGKKAIVSKEELKKDETMRFFDRCDALMMACCYESFITRKTGVSAERLGDGANEFVLSEYDVLK